MKLPDLARAQFPAMRYPAFQKQVAAMASCHVPTKTHSASIFDQEEVALASVWHKNIL